jgi:hypothetical protein
MQRFDLGSNSENDIDYKMSDGGSEYDDICSDDNVMMLTTSHVSIL